MTSLVWLLVPIALVDSLSVIPLCLIPMASIMGGKRPFLGSFSMILGIFIVYFPFGVLIALGLDAFFERFGQAMQRMLVHPTNLELSVQILIGLALMFLGFRIVGHRGERKAKQTVEGMTPLQAFSFGMIFTALGLWGALPYFAAIDQILRADPSPWVSVLLLLWYNFIFVLPLILLLIVGIIFRKECAVIFSKVEHVFDVWGNRVIVGLLVLVGFSLVVDGVGWFFGYPLFPVC